MDQYCDSDLLPQSSEIKASSNGLFVKFKIPKTSFDDHHHDDHNLQNRNLGGHVCHFCSKRFSSGKALGGHIRVHMIKPGRGKKTPQSYLRYKLAAAEDEDEEDQREIKFRSFPRGGGGRDEKGSPHSCCLCSKEFRSMKSLFGHMRNHPERGWRGIRPPPPLPIGGDGVENNSCSSSTVSENELLQQVDITKRRRIDHETSPSDHHNIEVPEAAFILMEMASAGQTLDFGKLVRNPSFVYNEEEEDDDDDENEKEKEKLGQMRGDDDEVLMEEKKMRKRKMEMKMMMKQQLDFDLNQPYVVYEDQGTLADHN